MKYSISALKSMSEAISNDGISFPKWSNDNVKNLKTVEKILNGKLDKYWVNKNSYAKSYDKYHDEYQDMITVEDAVSKLNSSKASEWNISLANVLPVSTNFRPESTFIMDYDFNGISNIFVARISFLGTSVKKIEVTASF